MGLEPTTRGLKERSSTHSLASPGGRISADRPASTLLHHESTQFRVTIDVTSHGPAVWARPGPSPLARPPAIYLVPRRRRAATSGQRPTVADEWIGTAAGFMSAPASGGRATVLPSFLVGVRFAHSCACKCVRIWRAGLEGLLEPVSRARDFFVSAQPGPRPRDTSPRSPTFAVAQRGSHRLTPRAAPTREARVGSIGASTGSRRNLDRLGSAFLRCAGKSGRRSRSACR